MYPPARSGIVTVAQASARSRASSALRATSIRGTPARSSEAVSDIAPSEVPVAFIPTSGTPDATTGETTATPSSGSSITIAMLSASAAYHCSWCTRSGPSGPRSSASVQRSTGAPIASGSSTPYSSSKAFVARNATGSTPEPSAIPSSSSIRSGTTRMLTSS